MAELRLIGEDVLERGSVYPLLPPNDIHRIETVGEFDGVTRSTFLLFLGLFFL